VGFFQGLAVGGFITNATGKVKKDDIAIPIHVMGVQNQTLSPHHE